MKPCYQSGIPASAEEQITATHEDASKATTEYVLNDEVVGRRHWDKAGIT